MLNAFRERLHQGYRTMRWPHGSPPPLPPEFRGRPIVDRALPREAFAPALAACPNEAFLPEGRIDLGRCLFCGECAASCPTGAVSFGADYRLAARRREDLLAGRDEMPRAEVLSKELRRLFGRSLKLRQVCAGGCNACEADCNVLGTVGWDMGRFGIQFVASPRHADGVLVTGPVTKNMRLALEKTWQAIPSPRLVITVGACAISGGPHRGSDQVCNGVTDILPVDLFIPGCPPHPLTILDGLLRLLGRIP